MPKKIAEKPVFTTKWMEIVEATIQGDSGETSPYYMLRYPWSKSRGIAILCYRDVEGVREYLGRYEYLPAHGEEMHLGSITGGVDKDSETYVQCAIRELEEEAGLTTTEDKVIVLGQTRTSKSSENTMFLFAVDYDECKPVDAVGDGTIGEEGSFTRWVSEKEAVWSDDVLLPVMIKRLSMW